MLILLRLCSPFARPYRFNNLNIRYLLHLCLLYIPHPGRPALNSPRLPRPTPCRSFRIIILLPQSDLSTAATRLALFRSGSDSDNPRDTLCSLPWPSRCKPTPFGTCSPSIPRSSPLLRPTIVAPSASTSPVPPPPPHRPRANTRFEDRARTRTSSCLA